MWRTILILVLFQLIRSGESGQRVRALVARRGQFPYHAAIYSPATGDRFAGALFSPKHILTAATPFADLKGDLEVYLGAYVLANKKEKDRINLKITVEKNIIVHEEYDHRWPLVDNIAIITLDEEVEYTDRIQPILLPPLDEEFIEVVGAPVHVSGWGARYKRESLSKALNFYNTTIFNYNICRKLYPIWERNICINATSKGLYCVGGWGSPVAADEENGQKLVGISIEPDSCAHGTAIPNTRVVSYLHWIELHTGIKPRRLSTPVVNSMPITTTTEEPSEPSALEPTERPPPVIDVGDQTTEPFDFVTLQHEDANADDSEEP